MNEQRFVEICGSIFDLLTDRSPKIIRFINQNHQVVGFAITSNKISDLIHANFVGYLLVESQEATYISGAAA